MTTLERFLHSLEGCTVFPYDTCFPLPNSMIHLPVTTFWNVLAM